MGGGYKFTPKFVNLIEAEKALNQSSYVCLDKSFSEGEREEKLLNFEEK
jgi:hypothetical protein